MNKIVLAVCTLYVMVSCENYELKDDFESHNSEYFSLIDTSNAIEVDFSKNTESFLEDVETKLNRNMCDDRSFSAYFNFNNTKIYFDAFITKFCDHFPPGCNKSSIITVINHSEDILSEGILFNDKNKFSQNIYLFTKERFQYSHKDYKLYELYWDDKTNPDFIKNVLYDILRGADSHKSKHSNFKTIIVFDSKPYRIPPPPPPLPLEYR